MNIGIFSPGSGYKSASGTGTFLFEMVSRLSREHEVFFLTSGTGPLREDLRNLDVQIKTFDTIRKNTRFSRFGEKLLLKPAEIETISLVNNVPELHQFISDNLDVVSTHYYLDNILLSQITEIPTIFHFPGIKQPSIRWRMMERIATPDLYLANSKSTAKRVHDWLDIDVDGIVYPGVSLEQFNPNADRAFDDHRTIILYVGRLDEGKGLDELVEAHARLNDTVLYLVGSGTLKEELQAKSRELGIENSVIFVGPVPHDEIQMYYTAADVFCLPSHHESLGLVNLEAMATGISIVTTHIDAIEEYVTDDENGLLVPPKDTDALTAALKRITSDPELRNRLSTAGLETAKEFSWEAQVQKMEGYYRTAANL